MKNLLKIAVFVISITMVAMPSFADNVGYSATVASSQSTSVITSNGNFGTIVAGAERSILKSVNLSNVGGYEATVEAKFSTNYSGTYGLVLGASNVIGASNFSLRDNTATSWIALYNNGNNILITTVPAGSTKALDARLFVPLGTAAGSYAGTVVLTFGNVV